MKRDSSTGQPANSLDEWLIYYLSSNLWRASDRVFKLVAWAVLIAGIAVFAKKSESQSLDTIAVLLIGLWFAALLHQLIRVGFDIQDAIADRFRGIYPRWIFIVVASAVSLGFIVVLIRIVLPAIGYALGELLEATVPGS